MNVRKPNMGHFAALVLCNNFYYNPYINYKLPLIVGTLFLLKRVKLNWVIFFLSFIFWQIITISSNSLYVYDDLKYFLLSTLQLLGVIGWGVVAIRYQAYLINPRLVVFLVGLSIFVPNEILNINLLTASIFIYLGYKNRLSLHIDWLNVLFSLATGWRAATVAFITVSFYKILFFLNKNARIIIYFCLIFCLSIVIYFFSTIADDLLKVLIKTGTGNDPTSGRLVMWLKAHAFWIDGLNETRIQSFTGYGYNYPAQMYAASNNIISKINFLGTEFVSVKNTLNKTRLHLHNFIYQNLIEFGLMGLLFQVYIIFKMYIHGGKIAILTTIGLVAGFFTSVFYMYETFFVFLYMLYRAEKNKRIKL